MIAHISAQDSGPSDEDMWEAVRSLMVRCMVVFEEGAPYLARFYLPSESGGVSRYAHYFFRSDAEGWFHNHPWREARCLIVTGGYREEVLFEGQVTSREYRPGEVNVIKPDIFHRVVLLGLGAWTLVEAEGNSEEWGFIREGSCYERWDDRNGRVKGGKSIEVMSSCDPRLTRYLEESRATLYDGGGRGSDRGSGD